jgi:hypothetical protein
MGEGPIKKSSGLQCRDSDSLWQHHRGGEKGKNILTPLSLPGSNILQGSPVAKPRWKLEAREPVNIVTNSEKERLAKGQRSEGGERKLRRMW